MVPAVSTTLNPKATSQGGGRPQNGTVRPPLLPSESNNGVAVPRRPKAREPENSKKMIMVAVLAELMEEYTVLLARVLEHLFYSAPFPRRVRFLILRNLPFASSYPHHPPPPLVGAPAA
ncbi:hypothetical protein EV1_014938 [Malus domestica]